MSALDKSSAIIEFDPQGIIIAANKNFCALTGYDEKEIVGKHHRIFAEKTYAELAEYRDFWSRLRNGEFDAREYKRITKSGAEVWIQRLLQSAARRERALLGV